MSAETSGASGVADRYATALFELAESANQLDAIAADLKSLKAMIAASAELRRFVANPIMSRKAQHEGMQALAAKAGFSDLTRRFLGVLAENRRLVALSGTIAAFLGLLARKRGEVSASVVSAKPLTEAQLAAVNAALKKSVGGNVALDATVDPGLLGGLVVKIGSRMFDSSLKTKLQQVQLAMKGVR